MPRVRLYFAEGEASPDGRYINENAINFNRPPPFPFRLQTKQPESGGHAGAELAGVLTNAYRDGTTLVFEGPLDMKSNAGQLAERLMREGFLQTWSPDLGDIVWDEEVTQMDVNGNPTRTVAHVVSGTYLGGTAVALPALASAVMELLDDNGNVVTPALVRGVRAGGSSSNHITACGASEAPQAAFFEDPELAQLQRWTTITSEGRVFGHAAGFGECHIGFSDRCITIDQISDCRGDGNFEYAMPGYVLTAEETMVGTGPIPIKGGHADKALSWQKALAHYDDPESVVADVVYGMDAHGVWFSGALRPTATKEQVYTLRASGVSLDAREIDGKLRYLATCCVNTAGFPKVSMRLAASAETAEPRILALVAAGGAPQSFITDECLCCNDAAAAEFAELGARLLERYAKRLSA